MWVHVVRNLKPCVKFNLDILQMESLKVVVQANQLSKVVMQNAPRLLNESGQSPNPCGKQCSFTIVDMTSSST